MPTKFASNAALALGGFFVLLGTLGFLANPLIGRQGLVLTDMPQDIAHIVLGLMMFISGFQGESTAAFALYAAGFLSLAFGGVGLQQLGSFSTGYIANTGIAVSTIGSWFHIALCPVLVTCGWMNTASKQLFNE